MRHFYLPSLLVLLLCTCGRAQDSPDYDSAMEAYQTQNGPGGAAIIVKNGEIVYHKAFGMASIELGVPMTGSFKLQPIEEHTFFNESSGGIKVVFNVGADGKVPSFTLFQAGQEMEAKRME